MGYFDPDSTTVATTLQKLLQVRHPISDVGSKAWGSASLLGQRNGPDSGAKLMRQADSSERSCADGIVGLRYWVLFAIASEVMKALDC